MLTAQQLIRKSVKGKIEDANVEAHVIKSSYTNFRNDFLKMKEQIKRGDHSMLDEWCKRMGAGVNMVSTKKKKSKK